MRPRISIREYVSLSVHPSVRNAFVRSEIFTTAENMAKLILSVYDASLHLCDRICPSVGLSVRIRDYLYLFLAQGYIVGL